MTTVPQQPPNAEALACALHDSTGTDHQAAAAVTLLTSLLGWVYAQPQFDMYLTVTDAGEGEKTVEVDWPNLGRDLLAGCLDLPHGARAALILASSITGGVAVHLNALLPALSTAERDLFFDACRHARGEW